MAAMPGSLHGLLPWITYMFQRRHCHLRYHFCSGGSAAMSGLMLAG
jgi:hypothetical protein